MQTPDQSSHEGQRQPSEPFYEFAEGIIYPPPPSFYQNMPDASERTPLPAAPLSTQPFSTMSKSSGVLSSHALAEGQRYTVGQQPVSSPGAQAPVRKSRRWLWIVIAILSVTALASCGLCSWAAYGLFSATFEQVSGALEVVNDYYVAIQTHNYAAAYNDLALQRAGSELTFDQFREQADNRDAQYGPVLSYSPGQPSYSTNPTTGPDLSRLTFVVAVSRSKLSYSVLLTLSKISGHWKITDFDRI